MALPSNISTGRVTGQFIVGIADGADADDEPDFIPATGFIAFTATTPYLPNATALPNPVTMLNTTIIGVLDDEGYLCTPLAGDRTKAGKRDLRLVATDDKDASVEGWTWTATPKLSDVNGTPLGNVLGTITFALPSNGTVDLTTVVEVPASQGIGTPQILVLAAAAQASATSAAGSAEAAADVVREIAGTVAGKLDADTAEATFQTKTDAAGLATRLGDASTAEGAALSATIGAQALAQNVPPYAPTSRAHDFNPSLNVYNLTVSSTAKLRAHMARSQGGFLTTIVAMGHSYLAGSNSVIGSTDVISALKKVMQSKLGGNAWAGIVTFRNGETRDVRYSAVHTGWGQPNGSVMDFHANCTTAGASLTFTSDTKGTELRIATFENSAPFTYAIDGGAPVTVATGAGTPTIRLVNVTGLADTTHTVVLTATTASPTYFIGMGVRRTTGLELSNFGYGGSLASQWTSTTATQKRGAARNCNPSRNIVLIQMDTNDARTGVPAATWKANMQAIINDEKASGSAVILIASIDSDAAGLSAATWNAYYAASYELSDQYDIPLVDTTHLFGGWTRAVANGLAGDSLHLNGGGWWASAEAVARLLSPSN